MNIITLQFENWRLRIENYVLKAQALRTEQHLRSAENALKEKDAELAALRASCGERPEHKPNFTPPPARKS